MMILLIWAFLYVFISKSVGKLLVFRWLSRWWLKKFAYIVWFTMKWKLESYIHSEAHSSFFFLSRVIIIYRIFLRHMMFQNFCLHCLIIQWYLVKIIPFWGLLSFVFLEESYSCISALLERGWWWWIISLPTLPDQSYRLWATDWMINSSEAQSSNLALLFWFYYFEFDLRDFPHILLNIFPKRKVLLGLLMVDTYFSL